MSKLWSEEKATVHLIFTNTNIKYFFFFLITYTLHYVFFLYWEYAFTKFPHFLVPLYIHAAQWTFKLTWVVFTQNPILSFDCNRISSELKSNTLKIDYGCRMATKYTRNGTPAFVSLFSFFGWSLFIKQAMKKKVNKQTIISFEHDIWQHCIKIHLLLYSLYVDFNRVFNSCFYTDTFNLISSWFQWRKLQQQ